MSILQIVEDGCEGDTALYIDGKLHTTIHYNDTHELVTYLYQLMVDGQISEVQNLELTDEGARIYDPFLADESEDYGEEPQHPEYISQYKGHYKLVRTYKKGGR